MKRKYVWIIAIFVAAGTIRGWGLFLSESPTPKAAAGVLDLRGWSLGEDGTVRLQGEWLFYPGLYVDPDSAVADSTAGNPIPVSVPGNWDAYVGVRPEAGGGAETPFGYGTYRMRVLLSEADRERPVLGIRSANVRTAHRLYASGALVGRSGEPGVDIRSTRPQNTPYVAEVPLPDGGLELIVHVANFHYGNSGGVFDTFHLGTLKDIIREEQTEKSIDYIFGSIFGCLGLVSVVMYGFRRQNPELFWFGLFFLSYLTFGLTHGEKLLFVWWPQLPYEWQSKLQTLSGIAIYVSLLYFIRFVFPRYAHRNVIAVATVVAVILSGLCLVTDVRVYTSLELLVVMYDAVLSVYLMAMMLFGVLTLREESIYALIGTLCLFYEHVFMGLTLIGVQPSQVFFPIEMLLFVIAMAVMLAKRFFENLRQVELVSAELRKADRTKSEFLANTSHELRTPLHGMISMAQVTLDEGGLNGAQEDRLKLIVSTGRNLSHLLDDILDLSRLNEGTLPVYVRPIDLRTAVDSVWEVLPYLTGPRQVRLENRIGESLPLVLADDQRMMQILFNLIYNAIRHAEASVISVEAGLRGNMVEVTVADDGRGIPEPYLGRIFDEFQQVPDDGGRTAAQGSGLGLAITKKLVELQGGTISAESSPSEYTRFRFALPAAAGVEFPPDEAAVPAIKGPAWLRRAQPSDGMADELPASYRAHVPDAPRLLVVEDDPVSLKVVFELLANEKYSVVAVNDGHEAQAALTGTPQWDAVILDISLPGMTGYELCRRIRERFPAHELPVLMLTARSQPADLIAGFEAGANDYVHKPVNAAELQVRVRALLQLKQTVREKLHMEMALIQAQIKPHFLYNVLNTIANLSESDPDRMRQVLIDFGQYLQSSFDLRNLNRVVPFAMEWKLVESYLSVEHARFGERLRVETNIPEQLSFGLPPLSIQPIVENALRHGILQRPGGGRVSIDIAMGADRISVTVQDDGVGFPEGTTERIVSGQYTRGIGLTNIHRRLLHMYGAGLHIVSRPGEGATVRFHIPREKGA